MFEPEPPLRDQLRYWSPIIFAFLLSVLVVWSFRATAPVPSPATRPAPTVVVTRLP